MNNFSFFNSLISVSIISLLLFIGCKSPSNEISEYDPAISDDYSDISDFKNYKKWGPYNVHDPSCIKAGDYFYLYSTDAYYFPRKDGNRENIREEWQKRRALMDSIGFGNIPIRRSKDLVHWEFVGWVLKEIPQAAIDHIEKASGGDKPRNIWAPYIFEWKGEYRLYYAVSLFGKKTSYIGMASSLNPEGPWELKGDVVKTDNSSAMNAIDPSVVVDVETGRHWMHYGSYFGGLYCVELNPSTGLALKEADKGHLVARRADYNKRNLEAPEIIYNPELKEYFLFTSYDALFTHYNVRVGRSKNPQGPFFDYFGKDLADTTNNFPILTYAYRLSGHPGWAGVGHCGVFNDGGDFFMVHQGRLAPDNLMIVLHVRKIFWNSEGWPVVSPERYAAIPQNDYSKDDLKGNWELISLNEIADSVKLWQGQKPPGDWHYDTIMFNNPTKIELEEDGSIVQWAGYKWSFVENKLFIEKGTEKTECMVASAWDWENKKQTIIFTGIQPNGIGIWGKKKNK